MLGLLTIGQMAKRMGVAVVTLRRWDKEGRLKPTEADGEDAGRSPPLRHGRRSRRQSQEDAVLRAVNVCADQKDDLVRQADRLKLYAEQHGWSDVEILSDLGSGLNYRKKRLFRLLDAVLRGDVSRIVVENKDRLLRFGAELVFPLCRLRGVEVVVTDGESVEPFETTLAKSLPLGRDPTDVLEIITVFSAKLYGARSHARRALAA